MAAEICEITLQKFPGDANLLCLSARANIALRQFTPARSRIEEAIRLYPDFALAHTGIADCHQLLAEYLAVLPRVAFPKAKEAALKALAIDDQLAEAHTSLAYTLAFFDWDWKAAETEFKIAIRLDPNYATAHQWYGEFLSAMGRFDESRKSFETALKLDPTSMIIQSDLAGYYFLTRDFDKAIEQSRKIIELDPNFAYGYVFLWLAQDQKGKKREAAIAYLKSLELFGEQDAANNLRSRLNTEGVSAM